MQLYSGDHRVRCMQSFYYHKVSGREEPEEKSAVHPAQRMAINMPTRYNGVYMSIGICKQLQNFFHNYIQYFNILQVAEVSHHMDGIAIEHTCTD